MAEKRPYTVLQNIFVGVLFIIIVLFTCYQEGYWTEVSVWLWIAIVLGFSISIIVASRTSTPRFVGLLFSTFIFEYVKETVGITSNMWMYHGSGSTYITGVWLWVLAAVIMYFLTTWVIYPFLRRLKIPDIRVVGSVLLLIIFLIIPFTLGPYLEGAGVTFWIFYLLVLFLGIYWSYTMPVSLLLSVVLSAWIMSNISEYLGSVTCHIWTFTYDPTYPPIFLLFGCWPLEFLFQYAFSAFVANEPLE